MDCNFSTMVEVVETPMQDHFQYSGTASQNINSTENEDRQLFEGKAILRNSDILDKSKYINAN